MMTYEDIVNECRRLRATHERAESEFFVFLMRVEAEFVETWREAGCSDFAQFLRSNHLCKADRYRFFAIGVGRKSIDEALLFGAAWTIEAGMVADPQPGFLDRFTERARAFVETEKVAPSHEAVRQWRAELVSTTREHGTIRRANDLERLREENRRLRAELRAAHARIAELEAAHKRKGKKAA